MSKYILTHKSSPLGLFDKRETKLRLLNWDKNECSVVPENRVSMKPTQNRQYLNYIRIRLSFSEYGY